MECKLKKLNLGCGNDIRSKADGWDNIDSIDLPGIDMKLNLDYRNWPIKDNTYDYIECKMVLEHLRNWPQAMEEIWRISKPGAKIYIEVPFFASVYNYIDPTHVRSFTYQTFEYFKPNHPLKYYTKAKFNIIKRYIRFSWNKYINFIPASMINLMPWIYSRYFCFIFPANSLEITLEVVK